MTTELLLTELAHQVPGGFDVCIEAVGFGYDRSFFNNLERSLGLQTATSEILFECFSGARPFGKIAIVDDYVGVTNSFPIGLITKKHLQIASGPTPCQKYLKYIIEMIDAGVVDPTFMITHVITLEEVPTAY